MGKPVSYIRWIKQYYHKWNITQDTGLTVNAGSALLSGKILSGDINHTCCNWSDTKTTPPHF